MRLINRQSTGQIKNVKEFARAETSLRNGNKTQYRQAITRLARKIIKNKSMFNDFMSGVKTYVVDTNQTNKEQFNPNTFVNYYIKEKPTSIKYLSATEEYNVFNDLSMYDLKNNKRKYNKLEGIQLYVQYVLDAMITQHNKKLTEIENLENEYLNRDEKFKSKYTKVDVEKSVAGVKTTMDLTEFMHQFLNEDIINAKSKKEAYIVLESYDEDTRNKILTFDDSDDYRITKKGLKETGSYTLLFINNLAYALAKSGWNDAYNTVLEMIRKDMIKEIYDTYNSLNLEIVWKYSEDSPVDDGNGAYDDESRFVEALEKAIEDKQDERHAAEKKKSKKQKTKKK